VNLKILVPSSRFQPYALIGVGAQGLVGSATVGPVTASDDLWGFATRPAVGLDVYLTENLLVNGEVGATIGVFESDGAVDDEYYLSFGGGLQYRF
jgi:hypothetical protein